MASSSFPALRGASWLDGTGATIGLVCAVHCMAFPLFVGLLPILGRLGEHEIERSLVGLALVIGAGAAILGWRRHRDLRLLALFCVGLGLLATSTTLEGDDVWLLLPASGLVAGAHLWSYRLGRRQALGSGPCAARLEGPAAHGARHGPCDRQIG